jgi:hypothetical protein
MVTEAALSTPAISTRPLVSPQSVSGTRSSLWMMKPSAPACWAQ